MLHPMVRRAAILIAVAAIAAASWATPAGALSLWPTCPSPPGGDYALCTRGAFPQSVLPGPDGAVWFTTARANLGRATAAGGISQFDVPLGAAGSGEQLLGGLAVGSDGNLWFPHYATSGLWRGSPTVPPLFSYSPGGATDTGPQDVVLGPDGALWVAEAKTDALGHYVPGGAFTQIPLPPKVPGSFVSSFAIANGPDGRLWVARDKRIDAVTPSGTVSAFTVPGTVSDLATGPDGLVWFAEYTSDSVGRIATTGATTIFPLPAGSAPASITTGPDGALWIGLGKSGGIMRMTTGGSWTVTPLPFSSQVSSITTGADGAIWFGDLGGSRIGRLDVGPLSGPAVTALVPSVGPAGTVVTVTGHALGGVRSVSVGDVNAAFTAGSASSLRVTMPPGAGAAPIRVRTAAGTSPPTDASTFSYSTTAGAPSPSAAPPPAPTVTVSAPSLSTTGTLTVSISATRPGAFEVAAALPVSGTKAHVARATKLRIPRAGTAKGTLTSTGTKKVRLKLNATTVRALRRAGRRGVKVEIAAKLDLGGGQSTVGQGASG